MGARRGQGPEAGLVGLLVTMVILGAMAAVAFAALGGTATDPAPPAGGLPARVGPAAGVAVEGAARPGAGPRGVVGAAATDQCLVVARTLATAAEAYRAVKGAYPASPGEVAAAGFLAGPPSVRGFTFAFEAPAGVPSGAVVVNGLAPAAGCAAPSPR